MISRGKATASKKAKKINKITLEGANMGYEGRIGEKATVSPVYPKSLRMDMVTQSAEDRRDQTPAITYHLTGGGV